MKKNLFGAALIVLAMTSCSNNEVYEQLAGPQAINFRPAVGKQTRVAEIGGEALKTKGFQLYAYLTPKEVNYANATAAPTKWIESPMTWAGSSWSADKIYYWPAEGGLLSYFCLYPTSSALISAYTAPTMAGEPAKVTFPSFTYTVGTIDKQEDLMVANTMNQNSGTNNGAAVLTLKHILSQINFSAKTVETNTGVATYRVRVKKIVVDGAKNKAVFTYNGADAVGTWGTPEGTSVVSYTYRDANSGDLIGEAAAAVTGTHGALMLMPQPTATTVFKLTVTYDAYHPTSEVVIASDVTRWADMAALVQGKKYRYTLALPLPTYDPSDPGSSKPISFTVNTDEWGTETPEEPTIQ